MHKKIIAGAIATAMLLPVFAFADTTDVQAQIQSLMSQIKALQEQLRTLMASSSSLQWHNASSSVPWMNGDHMMPPGQVGKMACITLNRNLRVGVQGDDVKNLQKLLGDDADVDFHGGMTGFFGPLTAKAMMKFQMKFGIASTTDGSVGPLTRGFFERQCGKGIGGNDMRPKPLTGTITASNASQITVMNKDGASVEVYFSASTTISVFTATSTPPTTGSISDLTVGKMVVVEGPVNSDGFVTAMHITVGNTLPPPPPMMDNHGMKGPGGYMPINGGQNTGHGLNGEGPQNW